MSPRIDVVEAGVAIRRRWPLELDPPRRGDSVPSDPRRYCSEVGDRVRREVTRDGRTVVRRSAGFAPSIRTSIGQPSIEVEPEPDPPRGFPWLTIIPSLVGGAVIAMLFSPMFMLFGLISAFGLTARAMGERRQVRKARRRRTDQLELARIESDRLRRRWAKAEIVRLHSLVSPPSTGDATDLAIEPWQQRLGHAPLELWIGLVDSVVVPAPTGAYVDKDVLRELTSPIALGWVPTAVSVGPGEGLAVRGDRGDVFTVARWLVANACTQFGPADLGLVILSTIDRLHDWEWAKWLPASPQVGVSDLDEPGDLLARQLAGSDRPLLVVVDGVSAAGPGPLAELLAGRSEQTRIIWIDDGGEPPAACRADLRCRADETGTLTQNGNEEPVRCFVVDERWVERRARGLAPFRDPEQQQDGTTLPAAIDLGSLIAGGNSWKETIDHTWPLADRRSLVAAIGLSDGPLILDLVEHGPHGLVAGTTGSGKSELLRTLVASLAISQPPDLCSFVLVDFKGGGAFDVLSDLIHVSAVVTDLDGGSAARCLRGLRAELRDREVRLREVGASEIADCEEFGRLVIVVDEFAALAEELPEFLDGLVDVARRGRSLGVHLILATQRPTGVVTGEIRANTNLRIALRVQDKGDSMDVLDAPDAALLPPVPGRAVVRAGNERLIHTQVASIMAPRAGDVEPFVLHERSARPEWGPEWADRQSNEPTILGIVEAVDAAAFAQNRPAPMAPWTRELGAIDLDALDALVCQTDAVALGRLDDPVHRSQPVLAWHRHESGLMIVGADAPTVDATVRTVVTQLGMLAEPSEVLVLDGSTRLGQLRDLAWVADVVSVREPERCARALERISHDLVAGRDIRLVIHQWPAVLDALTEVLGIDASSGLTRLIRETVNLGRHPVITGTSDRDIPGRISDLLGQRLVHALADPTSYLGFGIRPSQVPDLQGQDVLDPASGLIGKLGIVEAGRWSRALAIRLNEPPEPVRILAAVVKRVDLPRADGEVIPLGLDRDLEVVGLPLLPGTLTFVVGHPGSGRSTALATIIAGADEAGVAVRAMDEGERISRDEALAAIEAAKCGEHAMVIATTIGAIRAFDGWAGRLLADATVIVLNPGRSDGEAVRTPVPDLTNQPVGRAVLIDRGRTRVLQIAC